MKTTGNTILITGGGSGIGRGLAVDEKGIGQELDTNIRGVLETISAFLPHLKSRPASTIVNISSGLSFLPMSRFPVYCATKAFIHSFTMSLRRQLSGASVRVIELAPPWVATDLDASQPDRTTHTGMSPMAGAKFLYDAGVSAKAHAMFEQINQ